MIKKKILRIKDSSTKRKFLGKEVETQLSGPDTVYFYATSGLCDFYQTPQRFAELIETETEGGEEVRERRI